MTAPAPRQARADAHLALYDSAGTAPPPAAPFVALVPGAKAPLLRLNLPDVLRGLARAQVAQRQVSDSLGVSGKTLEVHPFAAKPLRDRWLRVLLADAQDAAGWRALKRRMGNTCRAILPDYLALPAAAGIWTVETSADRASVRLGLEDGFSCEPELAAILLAKAHTETPPRAVLRLGVPSAPVDAVLASLGVPLHAEAAALAGAGQPVPRRFAHGELAFDLSRDPAAATDALRRTLRQTGLPVMLLVLAVALWSAGTFIQTTDLQARTRQFRQATTTLVREIFVPTGPILDARLQVSQALAALAASAATPAQSIDALELLRIAGGVTLAEAATLLGAQSQPDGALALTLALADFAALDRLVAALERAGIAVTISDASATEAATVSAALILQAKARQ